LITTGESDGADTEIVTGALKDGDRVIIAALGAAVAASSGSKSGKGPGF